MSERSFTITAVSDIHGKAKGKANIGGRFISDTPLHAAKKAISRICRESKIKGQCTLVVTIKETTRGSEGKSYRYKGKRSLAPRTVERDGVEVVYRYKTEVSKY